MKTKLLIALVLILSFGLQAQDNPLRQGRVLLGFDVLGNSSTLKSEHPAYTDKLEHSSKNTVINLSAGYLVKDNLSVGLAFRHANDKLTSVTPDAIGAPGTANTREEASGYTSVIVESHYYFLNGKFRPFLTIQVGYSGVQGSGFSSAVDYTTKGSGLNYGGGVGLAYFMNDYVGFTASYEYSSYGMDVTTSGQSIYQGVAYPFEFESKDVHTFGVFGAGIVVLLR